MRGRYREPREHCLCTGRSTPGPKGCLTAPPPRYMGVHQSRISAQPHFKAPLDPRARQLHGVRQSHKRRPVGSNPSLPLNHEMRSDAGDGCHGYLWVTQPGWRPGTLILLKSLIQRVEPRGTCLSEQLLSPVLLLSGDGAKWSPELPAASPPPASLSDGVHLRACAPPTAWLQAWARNCMSQSTVPGLRQGLPALPSPL